MVRPLQVCPVAVILRQALPQKLTTSAAPTRRDHTRTRPPQNTIHVIQHVINHVTNHVNRRANKHVNRHVWIHVNRHVGIHVNRHVIRESVRMIRANRVDQTITCKRLQTKLAKVGLVPSLLRVRRVGARSFCESYERLRTLSNVNAQKSNDEIFSPFLKSTSLLPCTITIIQINVDTKFKPASSTTGDNE